MNTLFVFFQFLHLSSIFSSKSFFLIRKSVTPLLSSHSPSSSFSPPPSLSLSLSLSIYNRESLHIYIYIYIYIYKTLYISLFLLFLLFSAPSPLPLTRRFIPFVCVCVWGGGVCINYISMCISL